MALRGRIGIGLGFPGEAQGYGPSALQPASPQSNPTLAPGLLPAVLTSRAPASHQFSLGVREIDPRAVANWEIHWDLRNPNSQGDVRAALEFALWRGGGAPQFLTRPVKVVAVDGANPEIFLRTLPGGEIVSGATDVLTIGPGAILTFVGTLSVQNWITDDYGLEATIMWQNSATGVWERIAATRHEWPIPWVSLRQAAPTAVTLLPPSSVINPSLRFFTV